MYLNLHWTEGLSQKILIPPCMQYHVNIIFFYQACKFNYETALSFQEKQQSHVYGKLNYKASILDVYFFFFFCWGTQDWCSQQNSFRLRFYIHYGYL